jgi:hypothetical protein
MRYGRALLVGSGWAGTLGGLALCVLIFLSAYLAFDHDLRGVEPRKDKVVRLPVVREADRPRVPLGRSRSRQASGRAGGAGRARARVAPAGGGPARTRGRVAPAGGGGPRTRTSPPAIVPVPTRPGGSAPPASTRPRPASSRPPPASGGGGGAPQPTPPPTLGDTTSEVVGAVGAEVGRVSPPVGEAIKRTGETVGDAVDAIAPIPLPG